MTPAERRATGALAGIYAMRMLGLFLILPVFSLYAEGLPDATPLLVGLAIGAYGLSQALLQIPFGLLSDRIGRKPVILTGLAIFAVGSLIAALAPSIEWIIVGRTVQGSGAIAAAVSALLADLTRDEQRTKAMAAMGMTIGASFMLAMVLGPLLNGWFGVPGIFVTTALLAVGGILLFLRLVPTPPPSRVHPEAEPVPAMIRRVLTDPQLLRLDLGIFVLHMVLTAMFLAVPLQLRDAGLDGAHQSWLYLVVLAASVVLMLPLVLVAERRGLMKQVFLGAVAMLIAAQLLLYQGHWSLIGLALVLVGFFVGFNLLEASLPSLVSRTAPVDLRGTAMGIYSTSQFAGAFAGGVVGGWVQQQHGLLAVFLVSAAFSTLWLLTAIGMRVPQRRSAQDAAQA